MKNLFIPLAMSVLFLASCAPQNVVNEEDANNLEKDLESADNMIIDGGEWLELVDDSKVTVLEYEGKMLISGKYVEAEALEGGVSKCVFLDTESANKMPELPNKNIETNRLCLNDKTFIDAESGDEVLLLIDGATFLNLETSGNHYLSLERQVL